MKHLLVLCFVMGIAFMSVSTVHAQEDTLAGLREKIDQANKILNEASKTGDYATMARYYEDDVIILPNNEPLIRGKQAFLENEKAAEAAGYKVKQIETTEVALFHCDHFVHEVGTYKITLTVPNVPVDVVDTGKYLVIWKIQPNGSLRITLETWNNDKMPRYYQP